MESLDTHTMPIGRFARLTGLTVKALRHYAEVGLLDPAAVDPDTGYRSYSVEQVARAETIRRLRRLELPLDDVRTLLAADDPALVRQVLVDHQRRTRWRAAELHIVLQGLQPLIDGKETVLGAHAETIDDETRRKLAADCFNKTWTLMEKQGRTLAEDDEMLHCAHASRYHWGELGQDAKLARGEWQCSRVYAVLGRAEPALHHAERCRAICESAPDEIEDWDLPFAYEALARAHTVAGDADAARACLERAHALARAVADDDDRALLEADLATIEP